MTEVPAEGTVLAGKYRVERLLGQGGMGVVVAAWHTSLHRHVALKFLSDEARADAEAVERFMREARAAVRLESEHVARIIDVSRMDNGAPYMVMELLEGGDLATVLHERGPLPFHVAVDYILEALDAIAEAHANGILHRDLKPSNLFVAERADGTTILKVLDFGVSKVTTSGVDSVDTPALTATTAVIGTPIYMSPEQVRSAKRVDARTDIWALGVILYELLAGAPPFTGESVGEVLAAILESKPPHIRERRPDVPDALEQVIAKCLVNNRDERIASAGDLATALAPYGTPRTRKCVERVMGITLRTTGPRERASISDIRVGSLHPADVMSRTEAATPPITARQTNSAWGGSQSQLKTKRRAAPVALIGGAAAIVAAGLVVGTLAGRAHGRGDASPPPTTTASASASATAIATAVEANEHAAQAPTAVAPSVIATATATATAEAPLVDASVTVPAPRPSTDPRRPVARPAHTAAPTSAAAPSAPATAAPATPATPAATATPTPETPNFNSRF